MPTITFLSAGTDATQLVPTFFTVVAGAASTSDTGQYNTPPRSIKMATSGTFQALGTPDGIVADAGSRLSFWLRFDTTPTTDGSFIAISDTGGANDIFDVNVTSAGKLKIVSHGATSATGSSTLSVNTWYQVSVCYTITNSTTYTAKVYLGNVLEATVSTGTLSHTGTSTIFLYAASSDGWVNLWFDDVYIDNGSDNLYPGAIHVTAKRPFSNGTTNDFNTQIGAGGSGYGTGHAPQVNELPASTTNGWSKVGAGSAVTEEYNVEGPTVGDVNLTGATFIGCMGWINAKSLANETASLILNNVTSNAALTSTITIFKAFGSTYPAGSGTDIGLITTTALTTVSLYECGILIAYIPATTGGPRHHLPVLGVG